MITKDECVKKLYSDQRFVSVLKLAKDEKERKMIEETVDKLLEVVTGVLSPIVSEYAKDPEGFKKKMAKEIDPSLITVDSNKK